jgi:radical SAM protein with 4Fe4S-binding SPASM domain
VAAEAHPYYDLLYRSQEVERPIIALIELTNACNVDCEHCYLDLVPDKKIGALDTEEWKRIFRELADEGCLFLTLSGGEVLIRRDWEELARYARSLGFALRIFTNGTLITEDVANRIAAVKPTQVEISLLGGTAATHDSITRRRGSFDKTIAGVKRLRARGIRVLLKCVAMKKNVTEHGQIIAIGDALGCEVSFDMEVSPKNNGSREPTELTVEGEGALTSAVMAERTVGDTSSAYNHEEESREERLTHPPCSAGRRVVQIGPTGDVFPCTSWTKPLGNLRETSFQELWNDNPMFKEVRAKRVGSFPTCARCELLTICNPCMALSLLEQGNLAGPSPTKCRATEARAKARGMTGEAGGFKEGLFARAGAAGAAQESEGLVQIRRKSA